MAANPLSIRQLAARAGVSRGVPQELAKAGLLGVPLTEADVLVTQVLCNLPGRWTRSPDGGPSFHHLDQAVVAGQIRQAVAAKSLTAASVLVATPHGARVLPGSPGDDVPLPYVLLPLGRWWSDLADREAA